jgi:hypothetical protein
MSGVGLGGAGDMKPPQESKSISFWKIYGTVMVIDLLLYVLIFYVGRAIPSDPGASAPGNIGLVMYWLAAHLPATRIFLVTPAMSDSLMWILVLQDAWLAGLIYLWRRGRSRQAMSPSHASQRVRSERKNIHSSKRPHPTCRRTVAPDR